MRCGASSGGNGIGVQTDLVLCSELNSELVKSNHVPMWGLDPVSPVCSLSGQQQMAREEPQPKNLSCIVTLWLQDWMGWSTARHLHFIPAAGLLLKEKAISEQALTLELLLSDDDDLLASGRVWVGGRASCPCTQASPSMELGPGWSWGSCTDTFSVDLRCETCSRGCFCSSCPLPATVHGMSLQAPSSQVSAAVTLCCRIPCSSRVDVAAFPAAGQIPGLRVPLSALTSSPHKSCLLPSRARRIRPFRTSAGHKKMFFSADVVFLCT